MEVRRIVHIVVGAALVLVLAPAAASAQSGIGGVVRDPSGAVLPGVTVEARSPALIEGVRVGVTDGQGVYRIVDLRPGEYTVTFTLPGFNTLRRDGIDLPAEFTATVDAQLTVGALEETITVTSEAPVVDIRSSRAQLQFERETLEALPGSGRLATLSMLIPGAVATRDTESSVGASDRMQSSYRVHGAPEAQPVVDGMNQQVPGVTTGVYVFNQLAVQEVVVETSGIGADRDSGGMQLNMVPRDGGNTFSGLATFAYAGPKLEASNINDELIARGVNPDRAGGVKKFRDSGGAVGGPIRRDRLWFFFATREGVSQQYAEGVYYNALRQPASFLYQPDLSRPAHTNDYTKDLSLRVTWQVARSHKLVLANSYQPNCNCVFNLLLPGQLRTPEAAGPHHYNPNYSPSAVWTNPATSRLLFEAGGSAQVIYQHDKREPGWDHTSYRITDQGLNLVYGNVATRTLPRWQYQGRFAASYVTGSHIFKTGFSVRQTRQGDIETLGHDGDMHGTAVDYRFSNGVPNQVTMLDAPWNFEESVRDVAFYAQDQWTTGRLTLNLGARFNDVRAWTPEQILGAGRFVPERRFAPTSNVPRYRNLSPRMGAAYDLFGTGRTALKASLGHYPDIIRVATANPARALSRNTSRTWTDGNRNFLPDCDLLNRVANGECGPWSNLNFGQVVGARYADGALEGFNRQYHNWQGSVAVQHELRPGIGLNVGYFRTWYGGDCGGNGIIGAESCLLVTDNTLIGPQDHDPYCITVPADSRLPGSGGNQLCGFSDVSRAKFGQVDNLIRPASDFGGERTRVYNGVDLLLDARLGSGWQVQGGLAVGRTVEDNCLVVDSPEDARPDFCKVTPPWSAGTQVKFLVVYPLPWDIQTSAIYQNAAGAAITANYVVGNAALAPSLGRNLAACPTATGACNANVTKAIIPPQTMFEPRFQQIDLRFSRLFRLGSTERLRANFDLYNVFNASSVLASNTTYGAVWQNATRLQNGRVLRVGAQYDF